VPSKELATLSLVISQRFDLKKDMKTRKKEKKVKEK
jgi:hypothetical protein